MRRLVVVIHFRASVSATGRNVFERRESTFAAASVSPCVLGEMLEQQAGHPLRRCLEDRLMDILDDLQAIAALHPVRVGLDRSVRGSRRS
jgi:hypothetical protein